jgi:glutathione S-transferase
MPITFHYGSGSPPAWRVWLALEHKQLPYEFRLLSFDAGDLKRPEFLALNPRGRVPVITDGEFTLYESNAIVEYLEEQYPATPQLFPGNTRERARVRRWVSEIDDGIARGLYHLAEAVFVPTPDATAVARLREPVIEEFRLIAGLSAGHYMAGGKVTAADFALYPYYALASRLDRRVADLRMAADMPEALKAWAARIEALPYFAKTLPPHWQAK